MDEFRLTRENENKLLVETPFPVTHTALEFIRTLDETEVVRVTTSIHAAYAPLLQTPQTHQ